MKNGWQNRTFADVLEIRNGKNQKEVLSEDGPYPIYGSAGTLMGYATDYICEAGTTIIGRKGSINNPIYVDSRFWNVDTAFGLSPKNGLDSRFLYYFCLGYDFSEHNQGTTIPSLVKTDLLKIKIPVPPIEEQRRIVAILDEAFAAIDKAKANTEKNIQNARELFDSLTESVFRMSHSHNWSHRAEPLCDLCELIVDCEHKTAPTQDTGIPSIRTPNIGKGKLLLDGVYRVSDETYIEWTRRAEPKGGDLVLAREAPAGNVAVIPDNLPVCLGQRTVLIRPKREIFDPHFLAALLLRPSIQEKLLAHSRGATVQHVNMKDIRALNVGAIPDIPEQQRIVAELETASNFSNKIAENNCEKIVALDELKKSIHQKAFSGAL